MSWRASFKSPTLPASFLSRVLVSRRFSSSSTPSSSDRADLAGTGDLELHAYQGQSKVSGVGGWSSQQVITQETIPQRRDRIEYKRKKKELEAEIRLEQIKKRYDPNNSQTFPVLPPESKPLPEAADVLESLAKEQGTPSQKQLGDGNSDVGGEEGRLLLQQEEQGQNESLVDDASGLSDPLPPAEEQVDFGPRRGYGRNTASALSSDLIMQQNIIDEEYAYQENAKLRAESDARAKARAESRKRYEKRRKNPRLGSNKIEEVDPRIPNAQERRHALEMARQQVMLRRENERPDIYQEAPDWKPEPEKYSMEVVTFAFGGVLILVGCAYALVMGILTVSDILYFFTRE